MPLIVFGQAPMPPGLKSSRGAVDRFAAADQNQDGSLSREEAGVFMHSVVKNFEKIDTDSNGLISREEYDRWREQVRESEAKDRAAAREMAFVAADKDQDGLLSRDEVSASMPLVAKNFDVLDRNRDGKLSREELYPKRSREGGATRRNTPWQPAP